MIRSAACILAASRIVKAVDPEASPMLVLLAATILENAVRDDELAQAGGVPEPRLRMIHNRDRT